MPMTGSGKTYRMRDYRIIVPVSNDGQEHFIKEAAHGVDVQLLLIRNQIKERKKRSTLMKDEIYI